MKVINLTFAAFGPFKEKQTIDFTRLGNESIFLITGPTGAGKTTIFDAVCYALYGRASGSDRDHDNLRSDFASVEDHTEVSLTFAIKDTTYIINRKPKQLRPKSRGEGFVEEPQSASLYQIRDEESHLITSRIKDVNETIENIIGLDYDQFLKMIMIPQGEFRKLISENSNEREKILQKIFRTHVYQSITNTLITKSKDMMQQLKTFQNQITDQLSFVEWDVDEFIREQWTQDEEINQLKLLITRLDSNQQIATDNYQKQKAALADAESYYHEQMKLNDEFQRLNDANNKKTELEQQAEMINGLRDKFQLAEKAAKLEVYEEQLNIRTEEAELETTKLNQLEQELKSIQENYTQSKAQFEKIQVTYPEKIKEQEILREEQRQTAAWIKYIDLESKLEAQQHIHDRLTKQLNVEKANYEQLKLTLNHTNQQLDKQIEHKEESLKLTHEYTLANESLKKAQQLKTNHAELIDLAKITDKLSFKSQQLEQELKDCQDNLQAYEKNYQQHVASHLASQLKEGEHCPVCGSIDHPMLAIATHDPVHDQEKEILISKKEHIEEQISKLKSQWIDHQADYRIMEQSVIELSKLFDQNYEDITEETIEQILNSAQDIVKELTLKIQQIEESVKLNQSLKETKSQLNKQLSEIERVIEQQAAEVNKVVQDISRLEGEMNSYKQNKPDTELSFQEWELKLNDQQDKLEKWFSNYTEHEKSLNQLTDQVNTLKARYETQKQFTEQLQRNQLTAKNTFKEQLRRVGFKDYQTYSLAKLKEDERQQLDVQIKQYDASVNELNTTIHTLESKLKDFKQPNLTEIEQQLEKIKNEHETSIRLLEQLAEKHSRHLKILNKALDLKEAYTELDQDYRDMSALAEMANGDNHLKLSFERYVLSAFLEEILYQANLRLNQLTDQRYELKISDKLAKHGAKSGLDLEVFDQHTGKQRSIKTLSGGEGFQTSLCLALGMADVVQAHAGGVQLDTLFIDEGFGTLDEITLEQAISTLKALQQSNRVLGIISHVNQLKEEIHAKLEITSTPNGSFARFNL